MTIVVVLLILAAGAGAARGQDSGRVFRRIQPESGLSQNSAHVILQDRHQGQSAAMSG